MPFRSAGARAKVVVACLAAYAGLALVNTLIDVSGLSLMDTIAAGTATELEVDSWDTLTVAVSMFGLVTLVASAIAYLAWLSRAVENAPALGAGVPPRSPRAAIGWWFAPLANLWVPFTIVRDLHDRLGAPGAPMQRALLGSWWAMWIVSNVIGNIAGRVWAAADTVDTLRSAIELDLGASVLETVGAILALLVVRAIQSREDARHALQG